MRDPAERDERQPEPPLSEMVDAAVRRIVTGIVIAGAAIALGLYSSRPAPPRYEVDVSGSTVLRTDVRSGTVIACESQRCYTVVRRGQRLEKGPAARPLPAPPPPPRALPAPAVAEPAPAPARP